MKYWLPIFVFVYIWGYVYIEVFTELEKWTAAIRCRVGKHYSELPHTQRGHGRKEQENRLTPEGLDERDKIRKEKIPFPSKEGARSEVPVDQHGFDFRS